MGSVKKIGLSPRDGQRACQSSFMIYFLILCHHGTLAETVPSARAICGQATNAIQFNDLAAGAV
jgi:hypothetical protein